MSTENRRPFAVVTGASSGIGLELARQCVEHDFDVLICAEDPQGLAPAKRHLSAAGAQVFTVACDLATFGGCEKLVHMVEDLGRPIDALLLNAGIGVGGPFIDNDLEDEMNMIGLNVMAVVHLAKRLVPTMVERGRGRILVTASVASTSPAPYLAVYGATKAFDLSFAEALRYELRDTGVTVTALQPGATETEFFARANMEGTRAEGTKDDPAEVAKKGFEAMMEGRDKVIAATIASRMEGLIADLLPEAMKTKPGTAKH